MRKTPLLLLVAGMMSPLSCQTPPSPTWEPIVDSTYPDKLVEIVISGPGLSWGAVAGLEMTVTNNSGDSISILWNRSSIDYNGASHAVLVKGTGFLHRGTDIPDMVIRDGASLDVGVFPNENYRPTRPVYKIWPIKAQQITCRICVVVNGSERFYTPGLNFDRTL